MPIARLAKRLRGIDMPVLLQEMRVRQRGNRPFNAMLIYVSILTLLSLFVLYYFQARAPGSATYVAQGPSQNALLGHNLFRLLSFVQIVLVILIVPAYSAGAIAVERERGTFDLLALTMLSSSSIVVQKFTASALQALILVMTSLPITGIVFMIGGVSPLQMVQVYLILLLTAGQLSALGVLFSCYMSSVRSAMMATYGVTFVSVAGVPLALEWLESVANQGLYQSAEAAPIIFTLMFAFVGGLFAMVAFSILALLLSRRRRMWATRAFRMGVFGITYALQLLVMGTPGGLERLLDLMYVHGTEVPAILYMNPAVALAVITDYAPGIGSYRSMYGRVNLEVWVPTVTAAFAVICMYLFERFSVLKFNALRRV